MLALAQALRRDGVEAELDQYHAHRLVNWPRWCLEQLRSADYVLCVCTATYRDRIYGNVPADSGKGVLVISSELPELLGICDRIYVMNEGAFVGMFPAAQATQETIMHAIMKNVVMS